MMEWLLREAIRTQQQRQERADATARMEERRAAYKRMREREQLAARQALASSPMVEVPQVVLDALLDVYECDQEGMASHETYDIIRAWESQETLALRSK